MPELPEELVEALAALDVAERANRNDEPNRSLQAIVIAKGWLARVDLSSILRERDEARADAEKFADELARIGQLKLKARLEAAEGERDEARREHDDLLRKCAARPGAASMGVRLADARHQLAAMRGERDRLRALLDAAVEEYADHQSWRCGHPDRYSHDPDCPCGLVAFVRDARAALSTGDRQQKTLGGTGAAAPQTGLDGHKSEGGSPCS